MSAWEVVTGDSLEYLRTLPDCSLDACVTDPPYGLAFMAKKWDYDVPSTELWAEVYRVLKPGAHLLAFAGTRTQHRMAVRIEDAQFEIRDLICWVYGSGFPKNLNVSLKIDELHGAEPLDLGVSPNWRETKRHNGQSMNPVPNEARITAPATPDAQRWQGWGTALKPALEPITVARKPFRQTVARNVLEHGTGAINVDGCLVPGGKGRWPANLIHDGSDEVTRLFPGDDGEDAARFFYCPKASKADRDHGLDAMPIRAGHERCERAEGSAGSTNPRAGGRSQARNMHPTVKPTELMRYLCRLVTPPGGRVLDPFTGSGSTGRGAVLEGFDFLGIELDPEHAETARLRIAAVGDYDPRYAIRETSEGQMGLFGGEQ